MKHAIQLKQHLFMFLFTHKVLSDTCIIHVYNGKNTMKGGGELFCGPLSPLVIHVGMEEEG